jgi:hypothetical protein
MQNPGLKRKNNGLVTAACKPIERDPPHLKVQFIDEVGKKRFRFPPIC